MPWGKNSSKSDAFKESREKKSVQGLSYTKKPETNCNSCPRKPKQVNGTEQSRTGKLSRIL